MFNGDENKKSPIASKANRLGLLYGWRFACRAVVPLPAGRRRMPSILYRKFYTLFLLIPSIYIPA
jgi:hypothetical protein